MARRVEGPDQPRSWAIAMAACVINTLLSGISRTTGLLYVALIETYGVTRLQANLPFTVRGIVRNLCGPLVGAIGQRYGPRDVTIVGGVLAVLGITLCSVAPDVLWITILWGGVHGLGIALGNTLFQVIVAQYFLKYRATASGIALSGACVGAFLLPMLLEYLLKQVGLSGTFLLTGGLALHVLPASIMLVEPSWIKREISSDKRSFSASRQTSIRPRKERLIGPQPATMTVIEEEHNGMHSCPRQLPTVSVSESENTFEPRSDSNRFTSFSSDKMSLKNGIDNPCYLGPKYESSDKMFQTEDIPEFSVRRLRAVSIGEVSITVAERYSSEECRQEASLWKGLAQVALDPMFHIISLSLAAFAVHFDSVITIIVDYAIDKGLRDVDGRYFISVMSMGDLVGRLGFDWVTDRAIMTPAHFMLVLQVLQGFSLILVTVFYSFDILMAVIVLYGISCGASVVVFPLLVNKYLQSVQSLGIGCVTFLSGIITFAVPPLIGHFRDKVGSYDGMFWVTGGLSICTGFIWLLEPCLLKMRRQTKTENSISVTSKY